MGDAAADVGAHFRRMLDHMDAAHPGVLPNARLMRLIPDDAVLKAVRANVLPYADRLASADDVRNAIGEVRREWVRVLLRAVSTDEPLRVLALRLCELATEPVAPEPTSVVRDELDTIKPPLHTVAGLCARAREFRLPTWPQNFLPWTSSRAAPQMNREDPTDVANVSVEGIGERLYLSRAAEKAPAPKQKGAGSSSSAPVAKPMPPPKELSKEQRDAAEYDERQALLDRILKYRERFTKLKKRNGSLSIKSSLVELADEVHYIEQQLGREEGPVGALKPANLCFIGTMHAIEQGIAVYNPLQLKLSGLGNTTQQSIKQFEPLLDEFMIKHNMDMTASVEFRIIMMVVTTVATVHFANTGQGADLLARFSSPLEPVNEAS